MSEPYRCGKCECSFDEQAPLVMTVNSMNYGPSATVTCQHPGCGHSVTAPSLTEALQVMGEEKKQ